MYVYNRHKRSVRYLSRWIKYQMTSGHGPRKPWTWVELRPIRTIWFDQPPVGGVQTGQLKRRGASASFPLFPLATLWRSWTRRVQTRARLTWKPARWTLTTKPTIGGGLRPCQSRNGATKSTIAEESFPRWRHAAISNLHTRTTEGARAEHVTPETKNWTHAGKRNNSEPALNPSKQVQTEFLILIELVKILIWMQ